jgi:hypothetical protein
MMNKPDENKKPTLLKRLFGLNKKEETEQAPTDGIHEETDYRARHTNRKVIHNEVYDFENVPEYVKADPQKYMLTRKISKGHTVVTKDRESAEKRPNFEDLTQTTTELSKTEVLYGPWSSPHTGTAPSEMVEKKLAKQIDDAIHNYSRKKSVPEEAENVQVHYVNPDENSEFVIVKTSLEDVPEAARKVAASAQNHEETLVPFNGTVEKRTGFMGEVEVPGFAVETKNFREVPANEPNDKVMTTLDLDDISNEEARHYAATHPIANPKKHHTDKPAEEAIVVDLEVGERMEIIPPEHLGADESIIANNRDELASLLSETGISQGIIEEIVHNSVERTFFNAPFMDETDKTIAVESDQTLEWALAEKNYSTEDVNALLNVAQVVSVVQHYKKPVGNRSDFKVAAKNIIELATAVKKSQAISEEEMQELMRNASFETIDGQKYYSWSQSSVTTYAWHEEKGFVWNQKVFPTYSWFEPMYEYGIQYEYVWGVRHTYSYAEVYDYDIRIPQYVTRTSEPKPIEITRPLFSYRYDTVQYAWVEELEDGITETPAGNVADVSDEKKSEE